MKNLYLIILLAFSQPSLAREGDKNTLSQFRQADNLVFVENKGQVTDQDHNIRTDIDFKLTGSEVVMFVGDGQLHYQWYKTESDTGIPGHGFDNLENGKTGIYRMDVKLVAANKHAAVIAENKQTYYERYFNIGCVEGVTASAFQKIIYKDIYPNIDWVLYVQGDKVKYDFIVHPGGKVSDIRIQYEGATKLYLASGALTAETPFGSITEQPPYSYEEEHKKQVASKYVLNDNVLTFDIADHDGTLVIDPSLQWGTYFGNVYSTNLRKVCVDPAGMVYVTGSASNTGNIATAGVHQTTVAGDYDGYIVKFNSSGTRLWGTFFGGPAEDHALAMACDATGVYVAGPTESYTSGIATPGCHQPISGTVGVGVESFLMKFDGTGQRLWGTYYGGSHNDHVSGLTIDNSGNVYMAGTTLSPNNIATPGSFISTYTYLQAFLVKFNASGTRLWGTYYGGQYLDEGGAVVCDASDNVYLSGYTYCNADIATPGSHQAVIASTATPDIFLVKFNSAGARQWSTYYGGTGSEYPAYTTGYDPAGFIYLMGTTTSSSAIATPGSHQPALGGMTDAFLAKFDLGGVLQWSTYYGGTVDEQFGNVFVGPTGTVYITGGTTSPNAIATSGSHQFSLAGSSDGYLARFSPSGQRLDGTYYGGTGAEYLSGTALSNTSEIYLSGGTYSASGIATPGSFQPSLMSMIGGFLAKFIEDTAAYVQQPFIDTLLCPGQALQVTYGTLFTFQPGNSLTVQLSDALGSFANPVNIGSVIATGPAGTISCIVPSSTPSGTGYRIRIVASAPARVSADNGVNITISRPAKPTAGSNSPVCATRDLYLTGSSTTPGVSYSWIGPGSFTSNQQNPVINNMLQSVTPLEYVLSTSLNGCFSEPDTTYVIVNPKAIISSAFANSPVCIGDTLYLALAAAPAAGYFHWRGPNNFSQLGSSHDAYIYPFSINDTGVYSIHTYMTGSCPSDTMYVHVAADTGLAPSVSITASPGLTVSPWTTVTFTATVVNGGATPGYQWLRNGQIILGATSSTWSANNLSDNDAISVIMTSSERCAVPLTDTSNMLVIHINTGIDHSRQTAELQLYPNPNNGDFIIKGNLNSGTVRVAVLNAIGQLVYDRQVEAADNQLDHNIKLDVASGVYLLKVTTDNGSQTMRFNVKRD